MDVDAEAPSGCSIDALVRRLREVGDEIGSSLIDHSPVWYRAKDGVRSVSRAGFQGLVDRGEVGPGTLVHIPRNTPHRSRPVNGPATYIAFKSPPGNGDMNQDYNKRSEAGEAEALYPGSRM